MLVSSGFMEIQIWEFLRYFSFFFCLKHRVLAPWYILPTNVFLSVPSSFLSGLLEWMLSLEHPPLLCHFLTLQFPFCSSVTLYSMIDSPQEAICGPLLWRISYKNKLYYAVWEINLMGKQLQTAALCKQVQNKIQPAAQWESSESWNQLPCYPPVTLQRTTCWEENERAPWWWGAWTKKMPCAKTDALRMIFSHMGLWQQGKTRYILSKGRLWYQHSQGLSVLRDWIWVLK